MMDQYKVVDGTYYSNGAPDKLVSVLERCRDYGTRIVLDYGDTKTGKSWGERYDITGTISRSMGPIKIPILVHNRRSMGGGGILTDCVLSVRASRGKELLYELARD